MANIRSIGFDMDHTLVIYKSLAVSVYAGEFRGQFQLKTLQTVEDFQAVEWDEQGGLLPQVAPGDYRSYQFHLLPNQVDPPGHP